MTEQQLRESVANWLEKYLGIYEYGSQHKEICSVFNNSRLCTRVTFNTSIAWCAASVSAAFIANGLAGSPGSGSLFECVECSCNSMIQMAKNQGIWHENEVGFYPQAGDVVMYANASGYSDNQNQAYHVGMVQSCSGNTFYTIEGNVKIGGRYTVGHVTRTVNGDNIRGFITPNYAKFADQVSTAGVIEEAKATVSYTLPAFGIDISRFQGDFDLERAVREEGVKFVIIRAGGTAGTSELFVDYKFEQFYEKAKNLGLPIGCYFYSKATTVAWAEKEAEYLYENCLKGKAFDLPVYMDVEDKVQLSLSKRLLTDIVLKFCDTLEKKNCYVGIYAGCYTLADNLNDDEITQYTHWIADWRGSFGYSGEKSMWQFGGESNVVRSRYVCGQVVDQDYMYVDFPQTIRAKGLNGCTPGSGTTGGSDENLPKTSYYVRLIDTFASKSEAEKTATALNEKLQDSQKKLIVALKGDIDGDGEVTSADARLAMRMSVGLE